MNQEEQDKILRQQQQISSKSLETQMTTEQIKQAMFTQDQDKNIIKEQLDLSEDLERIEHLLKGDKLTKNEQTNMYEWKASTDNEMIILSNYGIHLIMNTVTFYLNKNTLLSNYDEDTILQKMEDFATDLTDTIFMEYEKVFEYPSLEDCIKILDARVEKKIQLKEYALKIVGKEIEKQEIKKEVMEEIENRIEKEIEKIKEQIIKNKLKRFMILIREIQDTIHSAYLRSYKGEERRTLRMHTHITESRDNNSAVQQQSTRGGVMKWLGRH